MSTTSKPPVHPEPRLQWLSSMIQDLWRTEWPWTGAKGVEGRDPLSYRLVLYCRERPNDLVWPSLRGIIRGWAEQNDCVAKGIRRYKDRVELDLLLKYLGRPSDYSPYEELPPTEVHWRKMNERERKRVTKGNC